MAEAAPTTAKDHANMVFLADLLKRAKDGELPRDRAPRRGVEPATLSELHINLILDRAAGYQLVEIAERWDYTPVQVANVLSHPDAQTILSTIQAMQAGELVSMEERFKTLAPLALNTKVALMQDPETPAGVRDRVATDILDRAGYAPRKQEEIKHTHQILMPAAAAKSLHDVLQESNRVASVDYSRHLYTSDADVISSHMQLESGQLGSEDDAEGGGSPVPASDVLPGAAGGRLGG